MLRHRNILSLCDVGSALNAIPVGFNRTAGECAACGAARLGGEGAGAVVLVVSVVYALKRTACPQCKLPWLQYALGEKSAGEWLSWLTTFTECPQCRYNVEDAANSSQGHT